MPEKDRKRQDPWRFDRLLGATGTLYRSLVEQVPAVVYIDSNEQRPDSLYISPQAEAMFGYPPEAFYRDPELWRRRAHPDDVALVASTWAASLEAESPFECEYRLQRPDGDPVWVHDSAMPVRGPDGKVLAWQGVLYDVTEAKRSEQALRYVEERYRALVENIPAVTYVDIADENGITLFVSPQIQTMLGISQKEWLGGEVGLWLMHVHPEDRERVLDELHRNLRDRQGYRSEYRMVARDGRVIWILDETLFLPDPAGGPGLLHGVMYDITDQKSAEEALRRAEADYRALVENIPAVIYRVAPDDDRRTLYVSPQVEKALGYTREEWLGQPDIWMELLHPDDRESTLAAHDLHNETGEPWSREYRLIASDGRALWFRDVATLVRDDDGLPLHWQGIQIDVTELKRAEDELRAARDQLELRVMARTAELEEANAMMALEIAERKRVEEELRSAEHKYRLLAEHIPAVPFVWDVGDDRSQTYVSPRIEQILGYTAEEWTADADLWMERLHPDDRTRVIAASLRSQTTGEPFREEYRYLAKDGHIVWVWDEAVLLSRDEAGKPRTFQGVLIDVTPRKEAEAKALESESRYRVLTEQLPAVTYIWEQNPQDGTSALTYVSPQIETLIGYTPDEWREKPDIWLSSVHPDDRDRVVAEFLRMGETGEVFSEEYRLLSLDGYEVWVHDQARLLAHDAVGRPMRFQGLMVDVTQTKRATTELRETEQKYRALVEHIPAMTYIELPEGRPGEALFAYLSPQTEAILGYTPEELIADPGHFERIVHPEDRERVLAADDLSERTGEPFNSEHRVITKDGRVVWLHCEAVLVRDEMGRPKYWHGVALDVTPRKQAEQDLRELEERYRTMVGRLVRERPPAGST